VPSLPASNRFSVREREVIPMLLDGFSNRLIARRLAIEESAVKARLRTIYRKLGVFSRAQAVRALLTEDGRPPFSI
jgi:DNA-binding NarL/FixJ family response regulator